MHGPDHSESYIAMKTLATVVDQLNRKLKALIGRIDECETRIHSLEVRQETTGTQAVPVVAVGASGVGSNCFMEASHAVAESSGSMVGGLPLDAAQPDSALRSRLQDIRANIKQYMHEHSSGEPLPSTTRDVPAPKVAVRPPGEHVVILPHEKDLVVEAGDSSEEDIGREVPETVASIEGGATEQSQVPVQVPVQAHMADSVGGNSPFRRTHVSSRCSSYDSTSNASSAINGMREPLGALHVKAVSEGSSSAESEVESFLQSLRHTFTGESWGTIWVSKMFLEANTTKVKGSSWDLCLFLFYQPMGLATNLMTFICVSFNCVLQLAFTYMVVGFIAASPTDLDQLVEDFSHWHMRTSSDVREQVCDVRHILGTEYGQMSTYAQFLEYTGTGHLGVFSPGSLLCLVVCTAWTLAVLKVVGEVFDQVKALARHIVLRILFFGTF